MWRSADWWNGEVYFPQLSKLLSTTHVMPVVDQGEASTSCVCHLRTGEKVSVSEKLTAGYHFTQLIELLPVILGPYWPGG